MRKKGRNSASGVTAFLFYLTMKTLAFSQSKPQQHTYLDNRVIKSQRRTRRTRSQSARARLQTKRHLTSLAEELGAVELSDKMRRCHSVVSALTCGWHIVRIIPNFTCEFRLCPDCARRRSRKLINKHLPAMLAFLRTNRATPVHLVLTQSHRAETRKESVKRLRVAFTKLQRREFWKEHFRGGTWSVEFTKDKNGFHHTHFHIIGFRSKFFHIDLLRAEWLVVTGDSHVLNLKPIEDLGKGLLEVVKYVSKPLDVKRFVKEDLADFLRLRNMQLFGTFGEYRKFSGKFEPLNDDTLSADLESLSKNLAEGCACPFCDEPLFDVRLTAEAFPDFLQGVDASRKNVRRE